MMMTPRWYALLASSSCAWLWLGCAEERSLHIQQKQKLVRNVNDRLLQVGWTFMKRVALTGPEAVSSILIQVVVLDDLIEEDDKRYPPTYLPPRRDQASRVAVISVICVICRALPCCLSTLLPAVWCDVVLC